MKTRHLKMLGKALGYLGPLMCLTACVTLSGNYDIKAVDGSGKPLANNIAFTATGSGIYSARNALCMQYPKATIYISVQSTGKNLDSESPYRCR